MKKLILVCVIAAFGCDPTEDSCNAEYIEGYDQGVLDGAEGVVCERCDDPPGSQLAWMYDEGFADGVESVKVCDAKPVTDNECFRFQYVDQLWTKVRYNCPE